MLISIVLIPFIISLLTHNKQGLSSPNFKCPNEYKTAEEYVEGVAQWAVLVIKKNPKIDNNQILKLRESEFNKHACSPSPFIIDL